MAVSLTSLGVNPDRLYHGQPTVAGGAIYTAPGTAGTRGRTQISSVRIANPSTTTLTCRLGLVPQGATEDGSHYLLGDLSIPANSTYESDVPFVLRPGDQLAAQSASLPAPLYPTAATATTGGTLAAASYFYVVTATNANGETLPSFELPVTTTGATSTVTLSWARVLGATGYKVYRSTTTGAELLLATVSGGATTSYTDTGAVTPSGGYPTAATAGGCIFTICGTELPA